MAKELSTEELSTLDQYADNRAEADAYDQMLKEPIPKVDRLGILFIASLLVVGVGFMVLGKVDEVVSAPGAIRPEEKTFRVESQEGGVVTAVMVKPGASFKKGEPLLRLDYEEKSALINQESSEIRLQENRLTQLRRSLRAATPIMRNPAIEGRRPLENQLQGQMLSLLVNLKKALMNLEEVQKTAALERYQQQKDTAKTIAVKKERIEVLQQKKNVLKQKITTDEANLEKRLKVLEDFRRLTEQGYYAQIELNQEEEAYKAREAAVQAGRNELADLDLAIFNESTELSSLRESGETQEKLQQRQMRESRLAVDQAVSEFKEGYGQLKLEIANLSAQLSQRRNLIDLKERGLRKTIVRMPFDGYIGETMVQNVGQVLPPGSPVAIAIRANSRLEAVTSVPNKDVGFIKPGIPVKIKVDAYPFQDFGTLQGSVDRVQPNVNAEKAFIVIVKLERQSLTRNNKIYPLYPGLTLTADFITRKKPVYKMFFKGGGKDSEASDK